MITLHLYFKKKEKNKDMQTIRNKTIQIIEIKHFTFANACILSILYYIMV